MAAAVDSSSNGYIWTSTNSGVTWQEMPSPNKRWSRITSSGDGSRIYATALNDTVYVSSDRGATWTTTILPANSYWLACSTNGNIVAVAGSYSFYLSLNGGTNWVDLGAPRGTWGSVVVSADGSRLAASMASGGVWIYDFAPLPPTVSDLPPQAGQTTAILSAKVHPKGYPTTVTFGYGTSVPYSNFRSISIPPGNAEVPVQVTISNLAPGTVYQCRVTVTNSTRVPVMGTNQSFTTLGASPTLQSRPVLSNGVVRVSFLGASNQTYTIEAASTLTPANWQKLTNVTASPTGIIPVQINAGSPPTRFLRTVQPAY